MRIILLFVIALQLVITGQSQIKEGRYQAAIMRIDGIAIPFTFDVKKVNGQHLLRFINGKEQIEVREVLVKGDSILITMPVFESRIEAKITGEKLVGQWLKETSTGLQVMPFEANNSAPRFALNDGAAKYNITGRFKVHFNSDSLKNINAVGEFIQNGNQLTGTFLTTTGDYRYLQGVVTGNQLLLSTFDGGHAFLFTANINNNKQLSAGKFFSGAIFEDGWNATKNATAFIPPLESAMYVKRGEQTLNFSFPDLDSNIVSLRDDRFRNKVVVVQIIGSWCPNCMDETAYLSQYYKQNRQRGVEILALAYEYTSNFARSKKSLQKFKDRFNVDYPFLITGVTVTDSLRTEKTLPELTPIKYFPTTIIIDKKGVIRKLDNGFYGPGTGNHFNEFKKEFTATIDALVRE